MTQATEKPIRKPVIIDPLLCLPIDVAKGETEACSCCGKLARWRAPPTVEDLVKQVQGSEAHLMPFCAICTIYKSTLFKGIAARLTNFMAEVEATGKRTFKKEDGLLVDENDAMAVMAAIWFVSYRDARTKQIVQRLRPTET